MEVKKIILGPDNTLDDISRIPIEKGDVFLIEIDSLEMPAHHYRDTAKHIKDIFIDAFPDNTAIVVPKGSLRVSVISPEDASIIRLSGKDI